MNSIKHTYCSSCNKVIKNSKMTIKLHKKVCKEGGNVTDLKKVENEVNAIVKNSRHRAKYVRKNTKELTEMKYGSISSELLVTYFGDEIDTSYIEN